jgi:hypothetical protein
MINIVESLEKTRLEKAKLCALLALEQHAKDFAFNLARERGDVGDDGAWLDFIHGWVLAHADDTKRAASAYATDAQHEATAGAWFLAQLERISQNGPEETANV